MEEVNYEKKYKSLKKKYKTIAADKEAADQQLTLARKRLIRLQKERSFLLDRLLQYEQVSSDSDSVSSPSDSGEERDIERPAKKLKKEDPVVRVTVGPTTGYKKTTAKSKAKDTSEEQVCSARGKDKPCKSKALQGFKYCWHHAPLDPATGFIFCQYRDVNKRNAKKCNIPVHKDKPEPFCNYHVKRLLRQQNAKIGGTNGVEPGGTMAQEQEQEQEQEEQYGEGEDVFSDQDDGGGGGGGGDGLDASGSGEEPSPPPPRFPENGVH